MQERGIVQHHNYWLFMLLSVLLIMPLISAAELFIGTYRQDQPLNLVLDCAYSNGTLCSANTACNISRLQYPQNGTVMIANRPMSQAYPPSFNITIPDTSAIGEYHGKQTCCDGAYCGDASFYYEITPTGTKPSTTEGILWFMSVLLIAGIMGFTLYGAITIPWANQRDSDGYLIKVNDLRYVKIFLWFMAYVLFIALNYLAYNITYGFLSFNTAANIFNFMYWLSISFFFPVMVVFIIVSVVNFIFGSRLKKELDRGLQVK